MAPKKTQKNFDFLGSKMWAREQQKVDHFWAFGCVFLCLRAFGEHTQLLHLLLQRVEPRAAVIHPTGLRGAQPDQVLFRHYQKMMKNNEMIK